MSSDDPVQRRAVEIRAEEEAAARDEADRTIDLKKELLRLVQLYLTELGKRTSHSMECLALEEEPHASVARFNSLLDGKVWTQEIFEFGIDHITGEKGNRTFLYYIEPRGVAFGIPNPGSGVSRSLSSTTEKGVLDYALAISIEVMARVVALGGILGSAAELESAIRKQEREAEHQRLIAKRERAKNFWLGCMATCVLFLMATIGIGLLGSFLRACSGG